MYLVSVVIVGVAGLLTNLVPRAPTIYDWLVVGPLVTEAAYTLPLAASFSVTFPLSFTLAVICTA